MDDKSFDNVMKLLLAGASLTAGAFLTALRSKLANTKKKNWLHISFYVVASLVLLGTLVTCLVCWTEIIKPNWFAIIVVVCAIIFSIALIWVTRRFLAGKHQYNLTELNPVVNDFSRHADKDNIKLLAGNLDFLGKSISEIEQHPQFVCLKSERFREVQILCTEPFTSEDKLRYGKIPTDLPGAQLKYYQPSQADLKVRGRIKTINAVPQLLIYSKVSPGRYEALELNTAETNGALYSNLWNLVWGLAQTPSTEQIDEYCRLYESLKH